MDNLDRTNVVQAALAKYTLNQQLRELGILSTTDGVDDFESFSKEFRESASMINTLLVPLLTMFLQYGPTMQTVLPQHMVDQVL